MAAFKFLKLSTLNKLRIKTVLFIAFFWTAIDFVIVIMREETQVHINSLFFREVLIFCISVLMGYFFVYRLKRMLRNYPLWINFLAKSILLLCAAFVLTFIIQFLNSVILLNESPYFAYAALKNYALHQNWLAKKNSLLDIDLFCNSTDLNY